MIICVMGILSSLDNGHSGMIISNNSPLLSFLSNDNKGNAFPIRHAPSNFDAIATTTAATVTATPTDNEDNDNNDVRVHPPPSQQQLPVATR